MDQAKSFFASVYTAVIKDMTEMPSERGVAFAFDLTLQFDVDGAQKLYDEAIAIGVPNERVLLARLRDASVSQLLTGDFPSYLQLAEAARQRREFLINAPLLSDAPFVADGDPPPVSPPAFPAARAASYFLLPRPNQGVRKPVTGVAAEAFVMGENALPAMYRAIKTATTSTDFIYMLNWNFDHEIELDISTTGVPEKTTLKATLEGAAPAGVQIRSMMWSGPTIQESSPFFLLTALRMGQPALLLAELALDHYIGTFAPQTETNTKTAEFLNGLNTGAADVRAILDQERGLIGTHHQKLLVVRGGGKLVAFVGGIEYNRDRIEGDNPATHVGPPQRRAAVRYGRAPWRTPARRWRCKRSSIAGSPTPTTPATRSSSLARFPLRRPRARAPSPSSSPAPTAAATRPTMANPSGRLLMPSPMPS